MTTSYTMICFHPSKCQFASWEWSVELCVCSSAATWESIAVVTRQRLHDVLGVLRPRRNLAVGLDSVDQLRASVLQRQRVAVIFVQLLEQPVHHNHLKLNSSRLTSCTRTVHFITKKPFISDILDFFFFSFVSISESTIQPRAIKRLRGQTLLG